VARHYKRYEDHSERWKKQAQRDGITPERWNGWLRLSNKTRENTNPRSYGAGISIATQRVERKRELARKAMYRARKNVGRASYIDNNVRLMTEKELDWTISASTQQIRLKAQQKSVPGHGFNPWRMYSRGT